MTPEQYLEIGSATEFRSEYLNGDRGGKFVHYGSIPGLGDYMIPAQDSARVEHWSRQPDGCRTGSFYRGLPVARADAPLTVPTSPQPASASPHSL